LTNQWLWGAIAASLTLQVLVVYVPVLQRAFGTVGLTTRDWVLCFAVASTVLWLREGSKLIARMANDRSQ
jgi:Ca2+-transporting ATPase